VQGDRELGTLLWNLASNSITLETAGGEELLFAESSVDRNAMYVEQMSNFIEVAACRLPPRISLDDGIAVITLIDALRQSASTGLPIAIKPE